MGKKTPKDAIFAYDQAIRLKPNHAEAYNNRGAAKGWLGRYDDALADCDQAIRLKPDYAEAYSNRGNAKAELGRRDDALADYDEAIRLKPDFSETYNNRGAAKAALGRHDDALADYDEAIRLKPDYAEAYSNRGNAKAALGRRDDALADYDEAIRLKPDYAEAYNNRGATRRPSWGDVMMPSPILTKRSASNRTTPKLTTTGANAKAELGRHDDALADYDEAIRLKPDDAEAYKNRGAAKAALGRHVMTPSPTMTRRCASNRTTPELITTGGTRRPRWGATTTPSPTMTRRFV